MPQLRSRDTAAAPILECLPPAMQEEILSRLPIRDAARTSVLSRVWRRRWEPVPYRFLDWPPGTPTGTVDRVVARCAHPFHQFRHPYVRELDFGRFNLWLLRLAAVGVRSVSAEFQYSDIYRLHTCIFSCRHLATLDLLGCNIQAPPPTFVGFPSLTTLSLSKVGFAQGARGLEALISSSPSLRTLQLDTMSIPRVEVDGEEDEVFEQWVINAPNLRRLQVTQNYYYGWHFSGLPFLEVADVSGLFFGFYPADRDFLMLISPLHQATKLKLSMPFTSSDALEGLSPSFENLKSLSLRTQLCFPSGIVNILHVVKNAPKLEELDIEFMDYEDKLAEANINSLYAHCADDLFSNLTNVRIKGAICERNEMLLIEFLLSKAAQLEALDVSLSICCSRSAKDVLAEAAQYGRASPGANVTIKRYQYIP